MNNPQKGFWFFITAALCFALALGLSGWNVYENHRAGKISNIAVVQLQEVIAQKKPLQNEVPDYQLNPNMEMPTITIDGLEYIGVLSVPTRDLNLPIISNWSYPNLKKSPCRYSGSVYTNNLVLAAHNYSSHFGNLKKFNIGEEVVFTDVDGNAFHYRVAELETLQPTAVEQMKSGNWDLTLFTCTVGGSYRVTVRCELQQ